MQEGREVIENLIDPRTFSRDFNDVEDMIDRLCQASIYFFIFNIS
jgi:hypothetical protein